MAGEIPDIKIIIGSDNDAVNTDSVQGPLIVSEPLIVKPANTDDVMVKPVAGEAVPPEQLGVLRGGDTIIEELRAVTQLANGKIQHLDPTNDQQRKGYLGISKTRAIVGRKTMVVTQGLMKSQLWNWTTGPVHCTANGVLTQNIDSDTFQVGIAIAPTELKIGIATAAASGGVETVVWSPVGAQTEWIIQHDLQRYPVVTLVDSAGAVMLANIEHLNINTVRVEFAYPTNGKAYLV